MIAGFDKEWPLTETDRKGIIIMSSIEEIRLFTFTATFIVTRRDGGLGGTLGRIYEKATLADIEDHEDAAQHASTWIDARMRDQSVSAVRLVGLIDQCENDKFMRGLSDRDVYTDAGEDSVTDLSSAEIVKGPGAVGSYKPLVKSMSGDEFIGLTDPSNGGNKAPPDEARERASIIAGTTHK